MKCPGLIGVWCAVHQSFHPTAPKNSERCQAKTQTRWPQRGSRCAFSGGIPADDGKHYCAKHFKAVQLNLHAREP